MTPGTVTDLRLNRQIKESFPPHTDRRPIRKCLYVPVQFNQHEEQIKGLQTGNI